MSELQHSYYTQRYEEQQRQLAEEQTATSSLLVNVVFVDGKGLSVSVVQAPSAHSIVKSANIHNNNNQPTDKNSTLSRMSKPLSSKGTGMFSNIIKGATGPGGVYVKAQLVPSEWFPEITQEHKTSLCKDDPAVIDEEIQFPSITRTSPGVERGGFLLLRLKLSRRLRSQVKGFLQIIGRLDTSFLWITLHCLLFNLLSFMLQVVSEALVPLSSTQAVSLENRRAVRHTLLTLTKPAPLHSKNISS